jgi:hypothetical protein
MTTILIVRTPSRRNRPRELLMARRHGLGDREVFDDLDQPRLAARTADREFGLAGEARSSPQFDWALPRKGGGSLRQLAINTLPFGDFAGAELHPR